MSSYPPPLPPAGTYQPQQQPSALRPETDRARTGSSATAEKYRPRTYSNPPPNQPDPTLLGPHQHPYTPPEPSFYPQQQQQPQHQPPYPQGATSQAPTPIPMPMPQALTPSYPNPPTSIPHTAPIPSSRHSSYTHPRPPMDYADDEGDNGRRHSYSSQVSRHSHDSRRSRDSKHSRHSRNSVDGRYDDGKAHHKHKHEHEQQHPNRTNERPTMGDSLVSMFGLIKSALGPRDK